MTLPREDRIAFIFWAGLGVFAFTFVAVVMGGWGSR